MSETTKGMILMCITGLALAVMFVNGISPLF